MLHYTGSHDAAIPARSFRSVVTNGISIILGKIRPLINVLLIEVFHLGLGHIPQGTGDAGVALGRDHHLAHREQLAKIHQPAQKTDITQRGKICCPGVSAVTSGIMAGVHLQQLKDIAGLASAIDCCLWTHGVSGVIGRSWCFGP